MEEKISSQDDNRGGNGDEINIKEYKKRWIMLGLFTIYTGLSTFQWVEYSIISNIISRYYNVSSLAVDMTSMTYMFYYVILVVPGSYMAERIGLRWTAILGSSFVCIGSWIKIFSVSPNGFITTFIGQSFLAVTQVVILTVPGRLAALWFPSRQISTATSLGIFGNQLGVALGFWLTPILVKNHEKLEDIGADLLKLFWTVAALSTASFILVVIYEPKLPPSQTRKLQKINNSENKSGLIKPIKRLMTNKSYLILCNSYGLGVGVLNVVGTLLNQMFLIHFKNGEEDAGRLGLLIIVMGMFGSVIFGFILDKTHKFKETTVTVYFLTLLGQILFAIAMWIEIKWTVYLAATFLGFFLSGYLALGYEMCAEYTYPESESIATGILNIANNIYGIILVIISGKLMETNGDLAVHICLCVSLLFGFIMTVLTKDEQKRQDAQKKVYINVSSTDRDIPINNHPI
ncbi:GSCOCG00013220001-RA-CDS [Cotesia congregata]|nr:GSCOCG00013220001-RA-CDS [Cotesia congregata]